jgi:hypothetical protein
MSRLGRYWKAIIAAIPLAVAVAQEILEQTRVFGADGSVSREDWLRIVLAALIPLAVAAKANDDGETPRVAARSSMTPGREGGWSEVALIVLGFVLAVVVLILLGRLS